MITLPRLFENETINAQMKYSAVQHLVESAYLNRSSEVFVAALTIYIDDSGTSPGQDLAVAAGWIAKTPTWGFFEREWDKARNIESDKFECMHMANFVGGWKEFEGWQDLGQKLRVATRLRKIVKKRALKGFGIGVIKKDDLKALGFQNHYTYAVRRVLGLIDEWRQELNIQDQPIEYIFDWMDRHDSRREEIESVFDRVEGEPEAFRRYGIVKGGVNFRKKQDISPLQAADMLDWTVYSAVLKDINNKKENPIAYETFRDFYFHRHETFIEGGYNTKDQLSAWIKMKGF